MPTPIDDAPLASPGSTFVAQPPLTRLQIPLPAGDVPTEIELTSGGKSLGWFPVIREAGADILSVDVPEAVLTLAQRQELKRIKLVHTEKR